MSQEKEGDSGEDFLSPKDMRQWAQREIRDLSKAHELRQREVNELATAYEQGKLTPEEADERYMRYHHRWDEALPGVPASDALSDEQILAAIDNAREPYLTQRTIRQRYEKLTGKTNQQR